ncbi:MAG: SDR family oxidoreductase [Cyclobacteriaceae bacterium]
MPKDFQDKVVWITGASSGIGEAMAIDISKLNARIILSARRQEELERVKSLCSEDSEVEILLLDLSDTGCLEEVARKVESIYGHIDILINNAGMSQRDTILNTKPEVERRLMEINFFGCIALSRYVLPKMIERKSGHHVVVSSAVGLISVARRSAYAASKHALHGWYDSLRIEQYQNGIHVTLICPGYILTNLSYNAVKGDGSKQNALDSTHEKGMAVEEFSRKAISAILRKKEEVYIGGLKEVFAIYLKRFLPGVYSRIIRKVKVT